MATARLSHKRTYDDFLTPHGAFGYSAHAGGNVEQYSPEMMDVMEEVVPVNKRAKFALHEEEAAQVSMPSTQARIAAQAQETMSKLNYSETCTFAISNFILTFLFILLLLAFYGSFGR